MVVFAAVTIFTVSTNFINTTDQSKSTYTTYALSGHNGDVGMGN